MQVKIIATTGEAELEQQINSFVMGKNVVDIKLTEWVSYPHETGGYTAYITYEDGAPGRQVQVKIFVANGEADIEQQVNTFIYGKTVVDIKFTEWAEYTAQTGGYTALVIFVAVPGSYNPTLRQTQSKSHPPSEEDKAQGSAKQFDTL